MESGFEQRSGQNPSSAAERGKLSPCCAQAGRNGVTYTLRVVGGRADHAVAAARVAASHPQPQLLPRHITGCRGVRCGVQTPAEAEERRVVKVQDPLPRVMQACWLSQSEGRRAVKLLGGCKRAGS